MKFRINIFEKHIGFVDITADNAADALENVSKAIESGKAVWSKTELMNARIADITVTCSHCGHDFALCQVQSGADGWHVRCPICTHTTAFTIPNDSETLRKMLAYCRVKRMTQKGGHWYVEYRCDTSAPAEKPLDSVALCNFCHRTGCHIHTAAIDCEALLDGEKCPEDLGDFWKA